MASVSSLLSKESKTRCHYYETLLNAIIIKIKLRFYIKKCEINEGELSILKLYKDTI